MSRDNFDNHTPLNLNNLFNRYAKPTFATLGRNKGAASSSNIPNIFLMVAVLVFSISFAYSINRTARTTGSRASERIIYEVPNRKEISTSAFKEVTKYPTSYNNQTIPQQLFIEGEQKYSSVKNRNELATYLIDRVSSYFMYNNFLKENGVPTKEIDTNTLTFSQLETELLQLEKKVISNYVTSVDFKYIYVKFADYAFPDKITKKYSTLDNAKKEAEVLIKKYQSDLRTNTNKDSVFANAKKDDKLFLHNNDLVLLSFQNYTIDQNFLQEINLYDDGMGINKFIEKQLKEKTVSEIYTLRNNSLPYAYLLIYPSQISQKQYSSIKTIYNEKKSLFTY